MDLPWYHAALLAGYAVAGILAWRVPRALAWVLVSIVILQGSWMWWQAGLPDGAFFGGALNLAMCFALYAFARQRWELRLWNCYHLMIVIDILYLSGFAERGQFVLALELANWLAIAIIGAAGVLERAGHGIPGSHPSGWIGSIRRALYANRSRPPFWQAED